MKILYLTYHGFSEHSGISKKMLAQIEGLRQGGHEVHVCTYDWDDRGHRCRFIDGKVLEDYGSGKLAALRKRVSYDAIYEYCLHASIEVVFVRSFHNANPWTINLFRKLKKAGIKCVMEIPTYPYDQEYDTFGWVERLSLKIDQTYRKDLAKQMEAIVTFSDADYIFGQKTIRISNGIDFDAIPQRDPIPHPTDEVHLLGVAEVHLWHAYDRLIHGLAEYYKESDMDYKKVYFHIVGGVWEKDREEWDAYIAENHLQEYVIFHGQQFGEELTKLFNMADFGIGSLGRHRSGITKIKTLKNREYAARGIPFIYSETDDDFETMPYITKAPADESPIEIHKILSFLDNFSLKPEEIRRSITHLSWKRQMEKVIDQIKQ